MVTLTLQAPREGLQPGRPWCVSICDSEGRTLRSLHAAGSQVLWDGRDHSGQSIPAGVAYLVPAGVKAAPVRIVRLP